MRTTVTLGNDVAAEVDRVRRERSVGVSEAVNELARAGLRAAPRKPTRFRQRTARLGLTVDVSDVADALEHLDGAR